jgi:hypothetical protein
MGSRNRGGRLQMIRNPLDVPLEDNELLDELELTANLMIVATRSPGPLCRAEIDRALGVARVPRQSA